MRFPSQDLQATVNSEYKNMASVMFFNTTWHVKTSGARFTKEVNQTLSLTLNSE